MRGVALTKRRSAPTDMPSTSIMRTSSMPSMTMTNMVGTSGL
jgi:hypothetical protein